MPEQDDNQVLPPAPNDNTQMELPSPAMDNVQELNNEPEQEDSFPDFYKTLGVDRDASAREIKEAYAKELEKLNGALANETIDATVANRVRQQLQQAYETLSNPFARKTYDIALEQMTKEKKGPVTDLWDSKYKDKFKDAFFGENASLMKCIILLIQFLVDVVKLKRDESLEKKVSSLNEELDERLRNPSAAATMAEQELPSPTNMFQELPSSMSEPQELPSADVLQTVAPQVVFQPQQPQPQQPPQQPTQAGSGAAAAQPPSTTVLTDEHLTQLTQKFNNTHSSGFISDMVTNERARLAQGKEGSTMANLYQTLGVPENASQEEINSAIAKPPQGPKAPSAAAQSVLDAHRAQAINVLSNPENRQLYDSSRQAMLKDYAAEKATQSQAGVAATTNPLSMHPGSPADKIYANTIHSMTPQQIMDRSLHYERQEYMQSQTSNSSLYAVAGVGEKASQMQVVESTAALNEQDPSLFNQAVREKTKQVLIDPTLRAEYDQKRERMFNEIKQQTAQQTQAVDQTQIDQTRERRLARFDSPSPSPTAQSVQAPAADHIKQPEPEPAVVRQARATMAPGTGISAKQDAREALASHQTVAQHHADPVAVVGQRSGAKQMTNPMQRVSFPNVQPDGKVSPPPKPQGPSTAAQPDQDPTLQK